MKEGQRVRIINGADKGKEGPVVKIIRLPISQDADLKDSLDLPYAIPLYEVELKDGTIRQLPICNLEAIDE
ncbi:KOW motif-containing protein [Chloroflexota bacterium]